jgi:hypothetical protein
MNVVSSSEIIEILQVRLNEAVELRADVARLREHNLELQKQIHAMRQERAELGRIPLQVDVIMNRGGLDYLLKVDRIEVTGVGRARVRIA